MKKKYKIRCQEHGLSLILALAPINQRKTTREKSSTMKVLLTMASSKFNSSDKGIIFGCIVFFVLSLFDGTLTLWGLGLGAIEEVNPIMQRLIEKSPIIFIVVKILIPVMMAFVLWRIRNKNRRFVAYSLRFILVVYLVVMAFHAYWMTIYFR